MKSKFNYLFTHRAIRDVEDILSYISIELDNKKAASDFLTKLENIIDETVLFPESGALVENRFIGNYNVRKKTIDNYLMFYTVDLSNKQIIILAIIYGKRDLNTILKEII